MEAVRAFSVAGPRTGTAHAQVTPDQLVRAVEEPHNWLMYSGGYASQRYSAIRERRASIASSGIAGCRAFAVRHVAHA
jgi:hypothetical protein